MTEISDGGEVGVVEDDTSKVEASSIVADSASASSVCLIT